jgi:uncharacterized protein involved in response to NO
MAVDPARLTPRLVPFAYGFRPFFLFSLAYALIAIGGWLFIRATHALPLAGFPPHLWHAHEMLFGFIVAAVAGFLLTAVPSWTGARGFAGWPLVILAAIWLAGRVAFAMAADLPIKALTTVELLFIPILAAFIAPPLLRTRNRNTFVLGVLALLWLADGIFLCELAQGNIGLATSAIQGGINLVLLLITVIAGRIVPSFTANALRGRGRAVNMRSSAWVEATVIGAMVAVVIVDVMFPMQPVAAIVAAVAAVAHTIRMAGWHSRLTATQPIVWVLHLAYAWLPVGFALKSLHLFFELEWTALWLHALTMGTAGTMIVAVITRAALGHTGRALVVGRPVAVAYALLSAATFVRVFGSTVLPYEVSVWTAGILWIGAFALLLVAYIPVLLMPRVDGRPG